MNKKKKNIAGIIIIVVVLGLLITTSIMNSYKYYYTVDEALEKYSELSSKDIKLAGSVKDGTVKLKEQGRGCVFVLSGEASEITIDYTGQVPDTFTAKVPVVVEGELLSREDFKAYSLLTKCASKYEEKLN